MLEKMIDIVKRAGEIVLSAEDVRAHTHTKTSAADLVTDYDVQVEAFLHRELLSLLPEAVFYGEEEAEREDPTEGWAFIVDPIDGTTNFVRGIGHSNISVALARDGEVQYGVVYNPYRSELFTGSRGRGAFLNGAPIHVSDLPLSEGICIMGTAIYRREYIGPSMAMAEALFRRSCDLRRFAAAALDLCYVACGRAEVFFEYSLCPWDHAAGGLILTEAGGKICTFEGDQPPLSSRCSVWASNAVNADVMGEVLP